VEVGPLRGTFADVAPGAWVAYLGSADTLEVAVRGGSAAAALDTPRERVGRELRLHLRPAG
jgi:S-adenosylmethionine hydrolase